MMSLAESYSVLADSQDSFSYQLDKYEKIIKLALQVEAVWQLGNDK